MTAGDVRCVIAALQHAGHAIRLGRDAVVIGGDAFRTLDQFLRALWQRHQVRHAA